MVCAETSKERYLNSENSHQLGSVPSSLGKLKSLLVFLYLKRVGTMTSIPNSEALYWNDEQTRFYLQLRIEEKVNGNVNESGRWKIIQKFYEAYGEKHSWKKFGTKLNTCKKQYDSFKRLTQNRAGLCYDSKGFLDMSEDWWNEICKEWPGASKIKDKRVANMDLMEELFGVNQQQGEEERLETMMIPEDPNIVESDDVSEPRLNNNNNLPPNQETSTSHNGLSSSNRSKTSRKRSMAQALADMIQSRDLIEIYPEFSCSQLRAMQVLNSLSTIKMWFPLYKASIHHLKEALANRETFLCYEDDENKVLYLEFATGVSRDA